MESPGFERVQPSQQAMPRRLSTGHVHGGLRHLEHQKPLRAFGRGRRAQRGKKARQPLMKSHRDRKERSQDEPSPQMVFPIHRRGTNGKWEMNGIARSLN